MSTRFNFEHGASLELTPPAQDEGRFIWAFTGKTPELKKITLKGYILKQQALQIAWLLQGTPAQEVQAIRRLLYDLHPCDTKSEKDGQLLCPTCGIDFARNAVNRIREKVAARDRVVSTRRTNDLKRL